MVVDSRSISKLFQCELQELVNGERGCWYFVLLVALFTAHLLDKVRVLAEFEGAPNNFKLVSE